MDALKKPEPIGRKIPLLVQLQTFPRGRDPEFFIKTSVSFLVALFLFFNSFPGTTAIKEICFYLSLLIALVGGAWRKTCFTINTPLLWPFLFFAIWCLATLPFALNPGNSTHDIYAHLIKNIILYYLLINFFDTEKSIRIILWAVILSAALFSLGAIIHFYVILGNTLSTRLAIGQYSEIPCNIIGTFTVCGITMALALFTKVRSILCRGILIACTLLSSAATLMTQTRGAFLALFISLCILFPRNKKVIGIAVLVIGLIFLILPTKNLILERAQFDVVSNNERIPIIYCFSEMIKDYPVTGIGFGLNTYFDESLLKRYNDRVPENIRLATPINAPHNFIVDVAVRTGFVGLALFLGIIVITFNMSWKIIRRAKDDNLKHWALYFMTALIALLIQGLFENTMSGPPAILLYTLFALITSLWLIDRKLQENIVLNTGEDS